MEDYVLGLDLGSNSIGWTLRSKFKIQPASIEDIADWGVRIFSTGIDVAKDAATTQSPAAIRTGIRTARKRYKRRRLRKIDLLGVLIKEGMCNLPKELYENWAIKRKGFPDCPELREWFSTNQPLELRNKLLNNSPLTKPEFGRALYHIAVHRGFKSNKEDVVEDEMSENAEIEITDEQQQEKTRKKSFALPVDVKIMQNFKTEFGDKTYLGQQLYKQWHNDGKNNGVTRHRMNDNKVTTSRLLFEEEFEVLCKNQNISSALRDKLYDAIFSQRPLKSQKERRGKCSFVPHKTRIHQSHPSFEEFSMWQAINDLRKEGTKEPLSSAEKQKCVTYFFKKHSRNVFQLDSLGKFLSKGLPKGQEIKLKPGASRTMRACPTIAHLIELFGEDWKNKTWTYDRTNPKNGQITKKHVNYEDFWFLWNHESETWLLDFAIQKLKLSAEDAEYFSKVTLSKGFGSLSQNAIEKILPMVRDRGLDFTQAVMFANMSKVMGKEKWDKEGDNIIDAAKTTVVANRELKNINNAINAAIEKQRKDLIAGGQGYKITVYDEELLEDKIKNQWGEKTWDNLQRSEQNRIFDIAIKAYQVAMEENH
jgi:CRISPR-associated endonuclease Csn1